MTAEPANSGLPVTPLDFAISSQMAYPECRRIPRRKTRWMSTEEHNSEIALAVGLKVGDLIGGRYQIVRLLGSGGMGAGFEARDTAIDKIVALKGLRLDTAR